MNIKPTKAKEKKTIKLQIVAIPTKGLKIECPKHGAQKIAPCYDPFTKKNTAITCEKCLKDKGTKK